MNERNRTFKKSLMVFLAALLLSSCSSSSKTTNTSESSKIPVAPSQEISENTSENKEDENQNSEVITSEEELSEDTTIIEPNSSEEQSKEEPSIDPDTTSEDDSSYEDISEEEPPFTIEDAGVIFADKFTDGEIIQTSTSYQSANVNVTFKEITYGGKPYLVQDIYIKNIESLSVGFAGLKFGAKYNDYVFNIVKDYRKAGYNLIGAINGDYCGLDGKGVIIRNGKLYGTGKPQYTICVLYKNGVMRTIPKKQFNAEAELEKGAWHAWDFGPSFLAKDGSKLTTFTEKTSISGSGNPRTAIGYFEPGHYCFITIGGRKKGNVLGASFKQMSAFANSLGCKVAYNLDGGQSAVMVFGDEICNEKNQGTGRGMSDIVFVQDFTE